MASLQGSALAGTYLLPQAGSLQQQLKPQQQYVDEVGAPAEGLQQIDGVTNDYFQKWAALKGFARDAWENLGVDVRFPDASVPESARLNRIYLKAVADLKAQGERLKTGQKMYEAALQRKDIINVDPRQQYFDQAKLGQDVVTRDLDPIVLQANEKLQQLYFGSAVKEAKTYYDQIKARLEQLRDTEPDKANYWQRQIDALTPPTRAEKQFAPHYDNSGNQARINASGKFLTKVANLMRGTADGYELSDTEFGENGERIWVNKDMQGVTYGGKPVVEWQWNPTTKETILKVKDGQTGAIQRIPLSGADAVSVAKSIVTENPRFAAEGQYIDAYADQAGYYSKTGEVNPQVLVDPNVEAAKTQEKIKAEGGAKAQQEKKQLTQLKSELEGMEEGAFFGDSKTYTLPSGVKLEVYRGNKGYYIENFKEAFPTAPESLKAKFKEKPVPFKTMYDFLRQQKAHLQLQLPGTQVAPTTTNSNETFDPTKY